MTCANLFFDMIPYCGVANRISIFIINISRHGNINPYIVHATFQSNTNKYKVIVVLKTGIKEENHRYII